MWENKNNSPRKEVQSVARRDGAGREGALEASSGEVASQLAFGRCDSTRGHERPLPSQLGYSPIILS